MHWYDISEKRPPRGQYIWVWDKEENHKFLIKYMGSEESWFETRNSPRFPIWAYLNESNEE